MNVTPEFAQYIQQGIKSGRFASEQDALDRALELLQDDSAAEREKANVRAMIEEGMNGPFKQLDFDDIKRRARAKWEATQQA
jgi:putative addiction module CopG family antidote